MNTLSEDILEHLVCPVSKYPLEFNADKTELICQQVQVAYPVRNGIPILIPMEGRILASENDQEK